MCCWRHTGIHRKCQVLDQALAGLYADLRWLLYGLELAVSPAACWDLHPSPTGSRRRLPAQLQQPSPEACPLQSTCNLDQGCLDM